MPVLCIFNPYIFRNHLLPCFCTMCRILFTLLDESEEIRHLAQFYIEQRLLKLNPKIMQSYFLEV